MQERHCLQMSWRTTFSIAFGLISTEFSQVQACRPWQVYPITPLYMHIFEDLPLLPLAWAES